MKAQLLLAAALVALVSPAAAADGADVLSRFFTPEQTAAARAYAAEAPDTADLVGLFRQAVVLEGTLLAEIQAGGGIWKSLEEYLDADLGLPGIAPGCVAECTLPALIVDGEYFKSRAASSDDAGDDAFFDLLVDTYGERIAIADGRVVSWPSFFEQTWDYGGHSLLGSGTHLRLLGKLDGTAGVFEEAATIREALMRDLLQASNCNGLPASEAVAEIRQILDAGVLDGEEKGAVEKRLQAFADPAAHGIEVGCREMGCSCNTG